MFYIRSNLRTFWGSSITYISLIGLLFFYQIYRKTHAIFARNTAINIKHLDLAWKWKTKHFEPEKGSVYVWHPPDRLLSSDRPHGGATWQNSNRRTCRSNGSFRPVAAIRQRCFPKCFTFHQPLSETQLKGSINVYTFLCIYVKGRGLRLIADRHGCCIDLGIKNEL